MCSPSRCCCTLLARPGEILTREELARVLWPDGTFVDFEHGVNSAVNRAREALGDSARNPRFIETLARRGYRFVAPVERTGGPAAPLEPVPLQAASEQTSSFLASSAELPQVPANTVRGLFIALQLMYIGFYVGALANLAEIDALFSPLAHARAMLLVLIVTAALLIPVRVFLVTAVLFPRAGATAEIPADVAVPAPLRRALGAGTVPAAAPPQRGRCDRVHGPAGLLTLRPARACPHE